MVSVFIPISPNPTGNIAMELYELNSGYYSGVFQPSTMTQVGQRVVITGDFSNLVNNNWNFQGPISTVQSIETLHDTTQDSGLYTFKIPSSAGWYTLPNANYSISFSSFGGTTAVLGVDIREF